MEQSRASPILPASLLRLDPAGVEHWPAVLPSGVMLDLTSTGSASALARSGDRLRERPAFLLLRVGALSSDAQARALEEGLAWHPDGIVVANCDGRATVSQVGTRLAVWEAEAGVADGRTIVVAEPGPSGFLALTSLAGASPRLAGLAWDAGMLQAGPAPLPRAARRQAQMLLTLAGAAMGLPVLDTPEDLSQQALERSCGIARRLGFAGKVATSADQVAVIARAFAAA